MVYWTYKRRFPSSENPEPYTFLSVKTGTDQKVSLDVAAVQKFHPLSAFPVQLAVPSQSAFRMHEV